MVRNTEFKSLGLTGAALFAGLTLCSGAASIPAQAQSSADLQARVQRLERDLRDLQAETFRRTPANRNAASAPAPVEPAPMPAAEAPPPPSMPDLNPLMRRINEIEDSIGRLTGQMEELGHQVDQLSQKADRLQKQMEFQANQQASIAPAPLPLPGEAATPPPSGALASAVPDPNAPKLPRAADSMLKLGLSLFELGQMKEGCAALAALPAKYPDASPAIATRARNERRDAKCR